MVVFFLLKNIFLVASWFVSNLVLFKMITL